MIDREKLIEVLSNYFTIGDSDTYALTRVKEGFAIGTVTLDDFVEWDKDNITDLADYIIKNTKPTIITLKLADRTPEEVEKIVKKLANINSTPIPLKPITADEIRKRTAKEIIEIMKQVQTMFYDKEYVAIQNLIIGKYGLEDEDNVDA